MHHKGGTTVLLVRTDQVNLELIGKLRDVTSLWMALAMQLHVIKQERARGGAFLCQGGCLAHTPVPRLFYALPLPCPVCHIYSV